MDLMQQTTSSSTITTKSSAKKIKKIIQTSSRTSSIETKTLSTTSSDKYQLLSSDEQQQQLQQQHNVDIIDNNKILNKSTTSKKLKSNLKLIEKKTKNDSIEEEDEHSNNDIISENTNNNGNIDNNNNDCNGENSKNIKKTRKKSTATTTDSSNDGIGVKNGKKKLKKSKKSDETKENNISVKSSFRKFDALQKKNCINVGLNDSGKSQDKFSESNADKEPNCRKCGKITYRMEEIKAEGGSWHKACFKCTVCNKQLSVDTFESHEGILYCKPHYKILMAPKAVEDSEPEKPKKHELIIRENQPAELPPDVVRASDKLDLGLEELQQHLNVRSRFQVFENYQENTRKQQQQQKEINDRSIGEIKRSQTILQKLARFQKKERNEKNNDDDDNDDGSELENDNYGSDLDESIIDSGEEDPDLVRAKRAQRERPIRFDQMNDIKSKFEKGTIQTREERREERKQELQNIRSRLFLGKQARIKEQYQQAVAESEHGGAAGNNKKSDIIDIGDKAKTLMEKFEKGEMFKDHNTSEHNNKKVNDEMEDVFESGISKQSRSLFMELDATAFKNPSFNSSISQSSQSMTPTTPRTPGTPNYNNTTKFNNAVSPLQEDLLRPFNGENLVKYDEKPEDIKIETSEISSKFKFFETYKSNDNNKEKKQFRITPPREGVVKMPSPDDDDDDDNNDRTNLDNDRIQNDSKVIAAEQHTTTKMLNRFRELEQQKRNQQHDANQFGIKPLKRFTPPPDDNRRIYINTSDQEDEYDEDDDEEEEEEGEGEEEDDDDDEYNRENGKTQKYQDEFLEMAKSAARAKQLRAKFEKWEANEIKREMNNNNNNNNNSNNNNNTNGFNMNENVEESQTESAKSLRAKFEQLKNQSSSNSSSKPKIQVNRFV